jgi:SAM-dependent methyltransferase
MIFFIKKIANKKDSIIFRKTYNYIDGLFRVLDNRVNRIYDKSSLIPPAASRYGGQRGLVEYTHTISIFQSLLYTYLKNRENAKILDFGCGTGKLAVSCFPFIGKYIGIDTSKNDIDIAKENFKEKKFKFVWVPAKNELYNKEGSKPDSVSWPVKDKSLDAVVGCSIFTHLSEEDSIYYINQIWSKLKQNGIAILSFFFLNETYDAKDFNKTRWNFDKTYPGSKNWYYSSHFKIPESQIGVDQNGINKLTKDKFIIKNLYEGNWKVKYGLFFQDILILEKKLF